MKKYDPSDRYILPRQCRDIGIETPAMEYEFMHSRKWRFDYAWIGRRIAVEIEGGYAAGRHMRHGGFLSDMEKYNHAHVMGWSVYRFTWDHVRSGYALSFLIENGVIE